MTHNRPRTRPAAAAGHRARTRAATETQYGLYADGCVAIKLRDDRGNWWIAQVEWQQFTRMYQAMAKERTDRGMDDGGGHNHGDQL